MDGRAGDKRFPVDRDSMHYLNTLGLPMSAPRPTLLYNPVSGGDDVSAAQLSSEASTLPHQETSSTVSSLNHLHRHYLSQSVRMPQHAYGFSQLNNAYLNQYNLAGTPTSSSGSVNLTSECFKTLYPAFPYWTPPTGSSSYPEGFSSHLYGLTQPPPAIYPSYLPLSCDGTRAGLGNNEMTHPPYTPTTGSSVSSRLATSQPASDPETVTQPPSGVLTQQSSLLSPATKTSQPAKRGSSYSTATVTVDHSGGTSTHKPASVHQSMAGKSTSTTTMTTTTATTTRDKCENEKARNDEEEEDGDDDGSNDDDDDDDDDDDSSDEITVDDQTNSMELPSGQVALISSPASALLAQKTEPAMVPASRSSPQSSQFHQPVKYSQSPGSESGHHAEKEMKSQFKNWHLNHSSQVRSAEGVSDGDSGLPRQLSDGNMNESSGPRDADTASAAGTAVHSGDAASNCKQLQKNGRSEDQKLVLENRDINVTGRGSDQAKLLDVKLEKEPAQVDGGLTAVERSQATSGQNTCWMFANGNKNCDIAREDDIKMERSDSPVRRDTYHDSRKKDGVHQRVTTASEIHSPGSSIKSESRSTRKESTSATVTVSADNFPGNIQYSVCRLNDVVQPGVYKVSATTFTPEIGTLPSVTGLMDTAPSFRLADNNNNSNSSYCSESTQNSTGLCCNEAQGVISDSTNTSVSIPSLQNASSLVTTSKMEKWSPSDCSPRDNKLRNRKLDLTSEQFTAVSPKKEICVKSEDQPAPNAECLSAFHIHHDGPALLSTRSGFMDKQLNSRHLIGDSASQRSDQGRSGSPQHVLQRVSPAVERSASNIDIKPEQDSMPHLPAERPVVPSGPCSWQHSMPVDRYDTLIHSIAPFYAHFMSPHYPVDPRLLPVYPDKQDSSWLQSSGYLLPASLPRMQLPPVFAPSQPLPIVPPELVRCPQDEGSRQSRPHNSRESEKLARCTAAGHGMQTQLECVSPGNDHKDVKVNITDSNIKSESPSVHDCLVHTASHKMTRKTKTKSERDDGPLTNCIHNNIPGKHQNMSKINIKSQSSDSLYVGKTCQMGDSSGPKVMPKGNERSVDRDPGHDILLNCPASASASIPVGIAYAHQRSTSQTDSKEVAGDSEHQRTTNQNNTDHDSDVRQVQQVKPTAVNENHSYIDVVPVVRDIELGSYSPSPWLHQGWSQKPIPVPSGYRLVQDKKSAQMFLLPETSDLKPQQERKCIEHDGTADSSKMVSEKISLQKTEEVTISTVTTETITKSVAVKHNNYDIITQTAVLSLHDDSVKNCITAEECEKVKCDSLTGNGQSQVTDNMILSSQPLMASLTGRTAKQAVVVKPQTTSSQSVKSVGDSTECHLATRCSLVGVQGADVDHYSNTEDDQEQSESLSADETCKTLDVISRLATLESRGTSPVGFSDDVPLKYLICRKSQTVSTLTSLPEQISCAIQTDSVMEPTHKSVMLKETCVQTTPLGDVDLSCSLPPQDDTAASVFSQTTSNLLKAASSIGSFQDDTDHNDHRNTPPVLTKIVDANPVCSVSENPNIPVNPVPAPLYYNGTIGVSQPTDGLHLLSILAEHLQRNNTSEERQTVSPDINKNYNAPKSFCFDNKDFVQNKTYFLKKTDSDDDVIFQPQWTSNIFKINIEPDNMDAMELDYRVRLAEIQRKYKEKQKQLAKLHKKGDERHSNKRKPGRPKRRGSQRSSGSSRSDDVVSSSDNISLDQNTKKKSHSKRTTEAASKKEIQKSTQKSSSNKQVAKAKAKPVAMAHSKPQQKTAETSENCQSESGLGLLAQYATCQMDTANTENGRPSNVTSIMKRKNKLADGSSQDEDEDVPAKKRKPGRPKKFDEESVTETIVAKKPKNMSFFSYGNSKGYGSAFRRTHGKAVFGNKAMCFMSKVAMLGGKTSSLVNKFTALGNKTSSAAIKPSSTNKPSLVTSKPSPLTNKSGIVTSKAALSPNKTHTSEGQCSAESSKPSTTLSRSSPGSSKPDMNQDNASSVLSKPEVHGWLPSVVTSTSDMPGSKTSVGPTKSEDSANKPSVPPHKYDISSSKSAAVPHGYVMPGCKTTTATTDTHANRPSAASGKPNVHSSKPTAVSPKPDIHGGKPTAVSAKPDIHDGKPTAVSPKPDIHGGKPTAVSPKPDIHGGKPSSMSPKPDIHGGKPTALSAKPDIHGGKPFAVSTKPDIHGGKPTAVSAKPDIHGKPTAVSAKPDIHGGKPTAVSTKPDIHGGKPFAVSTKPDVHGGKPTAVSSKPDIHGGKPTAVSAKPDLHGGKPTAVLTKPDIHGGKPTAVSTKPDIHGGKPTAVSAKPDIHGGKPMAVSAKPDTQGGKPTAISYKPPVHGNKFTTITTQPDVHGTKSTAMSSKLDIPGMKPIAMSNKPDIHGSKSSAVSPKSVVSGSKSSAMQYKTDIHGNKYSVISNKSDVMSKYSAISGKSDVTGSKSLSKSDILGSRSAIAPVKSEIRVSRPLTGASKSEILCSISSLVFSKSENHASMSSGTSVSRSPASIKSEVTKHNSPVITKTEVTECKSAENKSASTSKQSTVLTSSTSFQVSRSSVSRSSSTSSKSSSASTDTTTTTTTTNSNKDESTVVCSTISYRRRSERIFISESLQTAKASPSTTVSSSSSSTTSTTSSDDMRDDASSQMSKTSNRQSGRTDSGDRETSGHQASTSKSTKSVSSQKDGQLMQKDQSSNTGKNRSNRPGLVQDNSHKVKKKSAGTKTWSADTDADSKNESSGKQNEAVKSKNESKEQTMVPSSGRSVSSDSDSSSDGDSLPLSKLIHQTPSPESISCKLTRNDIKDNLSVLFFKEGLFYEATVVSIQPPDIYGVLIEGERGSRPHILPTEELLEKAVLDVKCTSLKSLPPGTRVCAYWSQQFSCLYPGSISKDGTASDDETDPLLICVEFDDGDSGKIPMEHIRLLPADFPLQDLETNPLMMISNRKRRSTGEDQIEIKKRRPSVSDTTGGHVVPGQSKTDNRPSSKSVKSRGAEGDKKRVVGSSSTRNSNKNVSKLKVHSKVTSSVKNRLESSLKGRSQASSSRSRERSSGVHSHRLSSNLMSSGLSKGSKVARSHVLRHNQSDSSNDDSAATSSQSGDSSSSTESGDDDEYLPVKNRSQTRPSYREEKSQGKVISPRKRQQQSADQMVPLQQLWQWVGKGTKRPGMKGKAKREYYKSIQRGSEIINVGDCAVFLSAGRTLPYVGHIVSLWQGWGGNMVVKVKWFYHPEETKGGKKLVEIRGALYQSPHVDENDVQTISHKCQLLSYVEWKAYRARKQQECQRKGIACDFDDDVYYLAGTYDPTIGMITFQPDVKLL